MLVCFGGFCVSDPTGEIFCAHAVEPELLEAKMRKALKHGHLPCHYSPPLLDLHHN